MPQVTLRSNASRAQLSPRQRHANQNCLLSELLFLCPHTNRAVGTGVWTDQQALAMASRRGCAIHIPCSACGMEHDFNIREGHLNCTPGAEDEFLAASGRRMPTIVPPVENTVRPIRLTERRYLGQSREVPPRHPPGMRG